MVFSLWFVVATALRTFTIIRGNAALKNNKQQTINNKRPQPITMPHYPQCINHNLHFPKYNDSVVSAETKGIAHGYINFLFERLL
jgi:hypothetical protein